MSGGLLCPSRQKWIGVKGWLLLSLILSALLLTERPSLSEAARNMGDGEAGIRSLETIGPRPIVFAPGGRDGSEWAQWVAFPRNAQQGPKLWYLLRMSFRAELRVPQADGLVYISASLNGRTATQAKLEVDHGSPKCRGGTLTTWSTLDLFSGMVEDATCGRVVEIDFRNYAQYSAVEPGRARLTFAVEQLGAPSIREVKLRPESGVEVTRLAPPRLRIVGQESREDEGEAVVTYDVVNMGDVPVPDLRLTAVPQTEGIEVIGGSSSLGELKSRSSERFRVRADHAGKFDVALVAESQTVRSAAVIEVQMDSEYGATGDDAGSFFGGWWYVIGGVMVLIGLVLARLGTRPSS